MNLHDLEITPPWEWPADAGSQLLATLLDEKAPEADRHLAAELAGELVVMNDELAAALINVLENGRQPEEIRARAAISLGPVLEQVDTDRFEDAENLPITEATFQGIQEFPPADPLGCQRPERRASASSRGLGPSTSGLASRRDSGRVCQRR